MRQRILHRLVFPDKTAAHNFYGKWESINFLLFFLRLHDDNSESEINDRILWWSERLFRQWRSFPTVVSVTAFLVNVLRYMRLPIIALLSHVSVAACSSRFPAHSFQPGAVLRKGIFSTTGCKRSTDALKEKDTNI